MVRPRWQFFISHKICIENVRLRPSLTLLFFFDLKAIWKKPKSYKNIKITYALYINNIFSSSCSSSSWAYQRPLRLVVAYSSISPLILQAMPMHRRHFQSPCSCVLTVIPTTSTCLYIAPVIVRVNCSGIFNDGQLYHFKT